MSEDFKAMWGQYSPMTNCSRKNTFTYHSMDVNCFKRVAIKSLKKTMRKFFWNCKAIGKFFKEILRRCRADCMRSGTFWVVNEAIIDFNSRMLWRILQISGLFTSACSLSGSLSEICGILHIRLSLSQWQLNPGCKVKYGSEKKCCRTISNII